MNRNIILSVLVSLLVLMAVLMKERRALEKKIDYYTSQLEQLQEEIKEEEKRSVDLEQRLPSYVASYEYMEKVAREVFNLVYEDEILIQTH